MAEIALARGLIALLDDYDYDVLSKYHWYPDVGPWTTYAKTDDLAGRPRLHKVIMNPPKGMVVDHLNRDGLDNRRDNLEIVTNSVNSFRALKPLGRVPFRGVHKHTSDRFYAQITVNYQKHYLGIYDTA